MNRAPFCCECHEPMRVDRNEVIVTNDYVAHYGDRFICPGCQRQIVTNFGHKPAAPRRDLTLDQFLDSAEAAGFVVYPTVDRETNDRTLAEILRDKERGYRS